jgi:hypothetical protein
MELLADHRAAASRGGDDVFKFLKILDELLRQLAGFGVVAVVEKWLATAGLSFGEIDLAPEMLEELRHRHAYAWVELIVQAGDEERDVVRHGIIDFADVYGILCRRATQAEVG